MRVIVNGTEYTFTLQGSVVSFTPDERAADDDKETTAAIRFAASEIGQLMRSRKDGRSAKVVANGASYLTKFESIGDRERFIELVVEAQTPTQEADADHATDRWVAHSICGAAVDAGIMDDAELRAIIDGKCHRGVVQAFDALETLVDRDTFRLRPITEQMENDIFRQIPLLAAIFQNHVVDQDTKRSFWDAVVRKYFCFSKTFLEDQMPAEGNDSTAAVGASLAEAGGAGGLSAINTSSLRALPKRTGASPADDEDDAGAMDMGALDDVAGRREDEEGLHTSLFRPTRTMVSTTPPANVRAVVASSLRGSPVFSGRAVARVLPAETTHRDVLETLRKYWRSDQREQRKAILSQYHKNSSKTRESPSFLGSTCLEQAATLL